MRVEQKATVCKALGHTKRIKPLQLISRNTNISLVGLCDKLDEDIKNISFHVAKLERTGLITKNKQGNFKNLVITKIGKHALTFVRMLE